MTRAELRAQKIREAVDKVAAKRKSQMRLRKLIACIPAIILILIAVSYIVYNIQGGSSA